ncbi:alpha/beta fold hydrolase [Streptomyces sp. P9-2B-2]|uniref:thioesterase II family protein n=1 Tax=Streptomyces TaxID=1883 RepID=UPI002259E975|nr:MULTISPECIES: alpha/beta fold hydrolase [Streptomyces]MCX4635652.1 alpha/beta fold hydrolase [Streptomyces platensis]WJY42028.1 alpha/beta fold hydrolase [Streptomyces sp. P9-2B-2]
MAGPQDTTVIPIKPPDRHTVRTLLCLGFCGGGTGPYHSWSDSLPAEVALSAICYPGREGRFLEPYAADWEELAADATAAVLSAADGPYVLFGHSMGGWMAFDVAARIEDAAGPAPEALVVSSCNAPDRGLTPRDMFPARQDTDAELLDWMRTNGLMPEHVLADPGLQEMAVELMRADIRVRDTFRCRPGTTVGVPVQMLSATDDDVIEPDAGNQWRRVARGSYRHDVLPGGHFYTPEIWRQLPAHIAPLTTPASHAAV